MGQAETKDSEVDKAFEKLTDTERKCLDQIFPINPEKDSDAVFPQLKAHLRKYFSSSLADQQFSAFSFRCRLSTLQTSVRNKLLIEIINLTSGLSDNVINFVLKSVQNDSASIHLEELAVFLFELLKLFSNHDTANIFGSTLKSCERFVAAVSPQSEEIQSVDLQQQLLQYPFISELFQAGYKYVFFNTKLAVNKDSIGYIPALLPDLEIATKFQLNSENSVLSTADVVYLNSFLPLHHQHKWRFLYSSNLQGESFSRFSTSISNQGPLLVIVRDQEGHIFGGYVSTNLEYSSKFQGDDNSFLFTIFPSYGVYTPTGYNQNYVYMNVGQETIPNGWAMGGRHGYFGLWLSSEFGKGHSKAKPTSTTYGNPRLSCNDQFSIDVVEAWGIGNEPKDEEEDDEGATSVIDKNPDAVAFLQIAGKEMASEGYRESERTSTQPEITHLHESHEPMYS